MRHFFLCSAAAAVLAAASQAQAAGFMVRENKY
jgi:long-subunit fatty acid transport protein